MKMRLWNWRRMKTALLAGVGVPAGLSLALLGQAAEPLLQPEKVQVLPAVAEPVPAGLAGLRHLALEKQPALAAYRASAAATEAKSDALDRMHLAALIRRDLPVRRKQAEQGVLASQAQLRKAEHDTLYGVTRTYLSVLYARQQLAIAERALDENDAAVSSLLYLKKVAQGIYKDRTRPDVKKWNVDQIDVLVQVTRGRREEASLGIQRALAALREAVGLEADCPLTVDLKAVLPVFNQPVTREQVVALALDRRGEIVQASAGIEVTSLEIDAQKRIRGRQGETFAIGSDLHAEAVPQGFSNGEYRPGAITIEMPAKMVGSKAARREQAEALQSRAVAVADKTRHLVTLEAEDAYYKWQEASRQAVEYEKAAVAAEKVADDIREGFNPNDKQSARPTLDDVIEWRVRATQLRVLANQARFNALLGLAALERVTAGGIDPGFDK